MSTGQFTVGDSVEVRFQSRERYYKGKITAARASFKGEWSYTVTYDDGDTEERVLAAMIRRIASTDTSMDASSVWEGGEVKLVDEVMLIEAKGKFLLRCMCQHNNALLLTDSSDLVAYFFEDSGVLAGRVIGHGQGKHSWVVEIDQREHSLVLSEENRQSCEAELEAGEWCFALHEGSSY